MKKLLLAILLLVIPLGCPTQHTNFPSLPDPSASAPVPSQALDTDSGSAAICTRAEQNLLKLGCKDSMGRLLGGPNKVGDAFRVICQNAEVNSASMHPSCLATKLTCIEVLKC